MCLLYELNIAHKILASPTRAVLAKKQFPHMEIHQYYPSEKAICCLHYYYDHHHHHYYFELTYNFSPCL